MKTVPTGTQPQPRLACPDCGNTTRFVEIMAEEAHVVSGSLNYIHLLYAVVDHYVCCECGETIDPDVVQTK